MINPFQMLKNPLQALLQQQAQKMRQTNPELYNKGMQMIQGKSDAELKEMMQNLAKERGIDLNDFASQFGIRL